MWQRFFKGFCVLALGGSLLGVQFSLAGEASEDPVVRQNLFSPDRKYSSPSDSSEVSKNSLRDKDLEKLRRNIILRGTYCYERRCWALLELKPAIKRLLELNDLPKDRTLKVEEGGSVGRCAVEEIKRGEVVLGNKCEGLVITLAESPERKKPVPPPTPSSPTPSRGSAPQKGQSRPAPSSLKSTPLNRSPGTSNRSFVSSPKNRPSIQRPPTAQRQAPPKNNPPSPTSNPFLELLKRIRKERSRNGSSAPPPPFPFIPPSSKGN